MIYYLAQGVREITENKSLKKDKRKLYCDSVAGSIRYLIFALISIVRSALYG